MWSGHNEQAGGRGRELERAPPPHAGRQGGNHAGAAGAVQGREGDPWLARLPPLGLTLLLGHAACLFEQEGVCIMVENHTVCLLYSGQLRRVSEVELGVAMDRGF